MVFMLIIQSRGQGIFNRVYTLSAQFFWYIAIGVLLAIYTDNYPKDILFSFSILLTFVVLFSIWLFVFNSGKSKVIEHGIELNENGVTYIDYGERLAIEWSHFTGYSVIDRFPRSILLKSTVSKDIKFSYYMFSSAQRRELFGYLDAK